MIAPFDGQALDRAIRRHMPSLDGLRGVAILLVLAHAFDVIGAGGHAQRVVDLAMDAGWIGVQLFFVLSGFLITGILLDTQRAPSYYRSFFVRRILRIFPLYYGVLLVTFVLLPLVMPHDLPAGHGSQQGWLWAYLENFGAPFGHEEKPFPHFWSLCVEEQFYLVWPFVVRAGARRGVMGIGAALVVIAIASRLLIRQHWGEPIGPEAAYMFTPARLDALAIGAILAAAVRSDQAFAWVKRPALLGLAGLVVVGGGFALGHGFRIGAQMQLGGYTVIALGFALILAACLSPGVFSSALSWSPLRRIGTYSYGMYVFHAPLHLFVGLPLLDRYCGGHALGLPLAVGYAITATLATFILAAISFHIYERRFLSLKDRLAPAGSGA